MVQDGHKPQPSDLPLRSNTGARAPGCLPLAPPILPTQLDFGIPRTQKEAGHCSPAASRRWADLCPGSGTPVSGGSARGCDNNGGNRSHGFVAPFLSPNFSFVSHDQHLLPGHPPNEGSSFIPLEQRAEVQGPTAGYGEGTMLPTAPYTFSFPRPTPHTHCPCPPPPPLLKSVRSPGSQLLGTQGLSNV